MGRKKAAKPNEMLTEIIMLRVTKATYDKLENIRSKSDCRTIPEVARRIINLEKIIFFNKDASMDAPMEILISIQKELKAIGVNINQVTRNFNSMTGERQRWYQIKRAAQYYSQVDTKVSLLLTMISQLAKKWLQK
ncbi:plasmid mobilization relaxosome protein MobC [Mucilaginibacter ginsenosidivorans]|uniref:Plasmid mobilization relaxosome protein MobC n=1 Tax=Mucilaginibacter ginsenosidivorans TaxID=398053 RepID=A0A5B8UU24_9SPHI|nr:plasmid mobilization relaxosome protein MobC [Mucilaginibacter ginsenosidivorans]QEC62422.1 plasmid mobilization relaxosome protein MobC [Mucilaginibacter ginsenosidivorans]